MHRMYGGPFAHLGGERMEWTVAEQGPRVVVEVRQENKEDGLYKACAVGPWGNCMLGTLMPEGQKLFLRRVLSIDSLKRQGVWPIKMVECRLVHSFRNDTPAIPWADEILCRSARALPRHIVRRDREGFSIVTQFDPRAPFPLTPLFCLSRVEGGWLIFSFREDGTPYIFQSGGKDSKEADSQRR